MGRWTIAASVILLLVPPFGPGSCTDSPFDRSSGSTLLSQGWPFGSDASSGESSGSSDGREADGDGVRLFATLSTDQGAFRGRLFPNHCVRVQVELRDRIGGAAPREDDTLLVVTPSRPELAVFSDEFCERVTTSFRIPAGFSTASVYVRSREGIAGSAQLDFAEAAAAGSIPDAASARARLAVSLPLSTRSPGWSEPVLVSARVREAEDVARVPLLELTPSGSLYLSWSESPSPQLAESSRPALASAGATSPPAPSVLRFARSVRLWEESSVAASDPVLWQTLQSPIARGVEPVALSIREGMSPRVLLGWRRVSADSSLTAAGEVASSSLEFSTALLDEGEAMPSSKLSWMSPWVVEEKWGVSKAGEGDRLFGPSENPAVLTTFDPSPGSSLLLQWGLPAGGGLRSSRFDFDSAVFDESHSFVGAVSERESGARWLSSVSSPLLEGILSVWKSEDAHGVSRLWGKSLREGDSEGPVRSSRRREFRIPLSVAAESVAAASVAGNGYDRLGVLYLSSSSAIDSAVLPHSLASLESVRGGRSRNPARQAEMGAGDEGASVVRESLVFRGMPLDARAMERMPGPALGEIVESGARGSLREPALAMDRRGRAYAAWVRKLGGVDSAPAGWELRFALHGDREHAWDLPVTLAGGSREISRVKLAVDSSGNAIVSWVEGGAEDGEGLRVRRMIQGVGWQPMVSLSGGLSGEEARNERPRSRVRGYELRLDRDTGYAAVGWMEESADSGSFFLSLLR